MHCRHSLRLFSTPYQIQGLKQGSIFSRAQKKRLYEYRIQNRIIPPYPKILYTKVDPFSLEILEQKQNVKKYYHVFDPKLLKIFCENNSKEDPIINNEIINIEQLKAELNPITEVIKLPEYDPETLCDLSDYEFSLMLSKTFKSDNISIKKLSPI